MDLRADFGTVWKQYQRDVNRGEHNYNVAQGLTTTAGSGARAKFAVTLVNLAARLQPNLTIEVQQTAQPATT